MARRDQAQEDDELMRLCYVLQEMSATIAAHPSLFGPLSSAHPQETP